MWVTQLAGRISDEVFEVRRVVLTSPMGTHWLTALAATEVQVPPTLLDFHLFTSVTQRDGFRDGNRRGTKTAGFGAWHNR